MIVFRRKKLGPLELSAEHDALFVLDREEEGAVRRLPGTEKGEWFLRSGSAEGGCFHDAEEMRRTAEILTGAPLPTKASEGVTELVAVSEHFDFVDSDIVAADKRCEAMTRKIVDLTKRRGETTVTENAPAGPEEIR
jgi:hypothetical protein